MNNLVAYLPVSREKALLEAGVISSKQLEARLLELYCKSLASD